MHEDQTVLDTQALLKRLSQINRKRFQDVVKRKGIEKSLKGEKRKGTNIGNSQDEQFKEVMSRRKFQGFSSKR